MLVVVTADGTVSVLDESASGLGGVGLKERRKFRVMINGGRMTMGVSDHEGDRIVRIGPPQWYSISVASPVAVVSVNGAVLAIQDSYCCFSTWDITTGLFIRRFVGHDDSTAGDEGLSCKCMPWLDAWPEDECPAVGHRSEITAMAISHHGDRIASADEDRVIFLWDTETAAVLHKIEGHNPCYPMAIAFSPDGWYFTVTDMEGFICEHRVIDGQHINTPYYPSNSSRSRCETRAVVWTPDSEKYICGYQRGQVRTVDSVDSIEWFSDDDTVLGDGLHLKRSVELNLDCSKDEVNALAISPDGEFVAVAGERVLGEIGNGGRICGFVAVYNSSGNKLRWKDLATPGHNGGVTSLSFSLDGKQLVSAGEDKYVRLWDPRDGTRLKVFQQYRMPIPRLYPPDCYAPEPPNQIVLPAVIVSATFCVDLEETPERHERRLAFAQGHHKRLGASSILAVLSPDQLRTIGSML